MEAAFRTLLTGSAPVTALVPAASIVWGRRVGLPAIALHLISDVGSHVMDGPDSLKDQRVRAEAWASTYTAAKAIADAIEARLDGHRDGLFQGVFKIDRVADVDRDQAAPDGETPSDFYRQRIDFRVRHNPAS